MIKMKIFLINFFALLFISYATSDECINCVQRETCRQFGNLNQQEQNAWVLKYPCPVPDSQRYGRNFAFSATAQGDYVCCPSGLVPLDNNQNGGQQGYHPNNNFENQNGFGNRNTMNPGYNRNVPNDNTNNWAPDIKVNNSNYFNNGINNQNDGRSAGFNNDEYNPQAPYRYQQVNPPPKIYFPTNRNPYVTSSPLHPGGQNAGNTSPGSQCAITSFPPKPETGCCGREASDTDRIVVPKAPITRPPQANNSNNFGNPSWSSRYQRFPREVTPSGRWVERSAEIENINITIEDRIAGGKETEFEQFPWTVLLRTTFDYGDRKVTFDCGGSLISSRYVLTAGHCVYDKEGKIVRVQVFLAEYDKRTFPKDCKIVLGQGEKCIENVVMYAENVIIHSEYHDVTLTNDIALIRLRGNAPYNNYIRPICLPSIDVDTPEFMNLRLVVVGWGRNGRYISDIKQSTVINLVPQMKCRKYYPGLTRRQVCAAGYRGEDTCKGDSGGPLMIVYNGKYQVVGVVSGKRADSPCGTAVPSLYTNVYQYRDWILSNIKN